MPDPISSIPLDSPLACTNEGAEEALLETPAPLPLIAPAPNAVQSLVSQFPATARGTSASGAKIGGDQNGVGYTYLGPTPEGGSYREAAAFVRTPSDSKPNLEAVSASIQYGHDNDIQVTALRGSGALSGAGYGISVTADALTARANLGEHNDDGSCGLNAGAVAEFIGVEGTLDTPAGSVTVGASLSWGASASVGLRDADHDGKPELCGKLSIPAFTVGACLEQFW